MNFKQMGLKYKFIGLTIAVIALTASVGGLLVHLLVKFSGHYSGYYLVLITLFYVVMGIIGVLVLAKYMIQPVIYLTNKVHEVQRGNFSVRIKNRNHPRWMDEMDRLFEGFNHMVQHLRQNINELTRAKEEAERISRELYANKKKLEAIFNSLSDGIMIIDQEYRILSANPVMAQFMGHPLEEIYRQPCYQMCNGTTSRCSFCRAEITFQSGQHSSTYCTKSIGNNKKERILEVHDFPMFDDKGNIQYIIEYVKDVTDAVKMQANLESSRRLAEIGQMAAKVAHEVRNPLNAIKGATHYLRAEIDDPNFASYFNLIEEQVERVNGVATELLDLSKPLKPVFRPGRLEQVVERCLSVTEERLRAKNIEVVTRFAPEIPEIPLDEQHMEQALINLIINSADAMDAGGKLTIDLKTLNVSANGDDEFIPSVSLVIRDTGRGIDPDQLADIFQPFFTTKIQGTGLGLTIVKKVIDQHKGAIEIESQPGKGTQISLKLPLKPQKYEAQEYTVSH